MAVAGVPKLRCAGVAAAGALLVASGGTGTAHAAPADLPGIVQAAPQGTAKGTTYYVDSGHGSDQAAGTSANTAWKSLARVERAAFKPGDTVAFKRGGKWSGQLTLRGDGTAQQRITLTSYGLGSRPRISGGADCLDVRGSYWIIANVRVSGCGWAGVELRGSYNVVAGVRAEKSVAGVVVDDESHHNTIRDSQIIGNDRMVVGRNGPDDDAGAFGILLNGDDNLVRRNLISGSSAPSPDYGQDGAAVEIYNGDRNRVDFNVTRQNDAFTELGHAPGKTADGNVFAYNVVTSSLEHGSFLVTRGAQDKGLGPVANTLVENNSVYLTGAKTEGWSCYAGCAPGILKLRNNVVKVGGRTGWEDGKGANEDTGVYAGGRGTFALGPRSAFVEPQFVSATDLHLRTGSPVAGRAGEPTRYRTDAEGKPVPTDGPRVGAYQDTR